jgi:hypothetical protein
MYRMSMLAFAIRDTRIDRDRLMKICMVHDLAESIVGDITPYDGVSKVHTLQTPYHLYLCYCMYHLYLCYCMF